MKFKQIRCCLSLVFSLLICAMPQELRAEQDPLADLEQEMAPKAEAKTATTSDDLPLSGAEPQKERALEENLKVSEDDIFLPKPVETEKTKPVAEEKHEKEEPDFEANKMPAPSLGKEANEPVVEHALPAALSGVEETQKMENSSVGPRPVEDMREMKNEVQKIRPAFGLHVGAVHRSYPSALVPKAKDGKTIGASYRLFDFHKIFTLELFASASFVNLGDVGTYQNIRDTEFRYGPVIGVNLERRFSLFANVFRRTNNVLTDPPFVNDYGITTPHNAADLTYIKKTSDLQFGIGAQYDFYIIPHGSLGFRAYLEKNLASLTLSFALEPIPNRKLSLDEIDSD